MAASENRATTPISDQGRLLLAALSVGVGAIHLAMVPSHAGDWLLGGMALAAAGWVQIGLGLALLLLSGPSHAVVRVSCLANALFVAAWVVTRVSGWPFGPSSGVPLEATFIDITTVVFEALLVVIGYELLLRPAMGRGLEGRARLFASVVPVGVLLFATVAIASPSAVNHGQGSPAPAETAAGTTAPANTPVDDKGLSVIMNGKGEGGGHAHSDVVEPVSASDQKKLDAQLETTKAFIQKYPTVADATAAGYYRQGPFSPGLGAHYMAAGAPNVSVDKTMNEKSLGNPTLIYDGIKPTSKLAGFMYLIYSLDTKNAPEGFAGPNDHWHYHTNVCIKGRPDGGVDAPLGADTTATKALCDTYGGVLIENTGYMVHVWTVPGYSSPQGTFSNLNSKIMCPNKTYYVVAPEEIGTRANICKDVAI